MDTKSTSPFMMTLFTPSPRRLPLTVKTLQSIVSDAPSCRITFPWTITVSTTSQFFPSGTSTVSWVPDNGPSHLVTAAATLLVPAIRVATEIAIDKKSRLIISCVGFIFVASFLLAVSSFSRCPVVDGVVLSIVLYGAEKEALEGTQGCFPYAIPPYTRYGGATHTEPLTRRQLMDS